VVVNHRFSSGQTPLIRGGSPHTPGEPHWLYPKTTFPRNGYKQKAWRLFFAARLRPGCTLDRLQTNNDGFQSVNTIVKSVKSRWDGIFRGTGLECPLFKEKLWSELGGSSADSRGQGIDRA
jgi:hypothetical protein